MFRGLPLVLLAAVTGRGTAVVAVAVAFALAHISNPNVTALGLGNIALAGVLLGLAFYAPGGIWTATGVHLGWNALLACLDTPVSGVPFRIPLLDYRPGGPVWLTGGGFGPEGGLAATLAMTLGIVLARRWAGKERGMNRAAVIGAGTMGNGIAHVLAQHEWDVALIDSVPAALEKATATIRTNLDRQVKKGTLPAEAPAAVLGRIHPGTGARGGGRARASSSRPRARIRRSSSRCSSSSTGWRRRGRSWPRTPARSRSPRSGRGPGGRAR